MVKVTVTAVSSTSIAVDWSFDTSDGTSIPNFVGVHEFDGQGHQLDNNSNDLSPLAGSVLFSGLKPNTTYYYQFCTVTSGVGGDDTACSPWYQYSGTTLKSSSPPPPSPPPSPTTVQLTGVQPYPRHLQSQGTGWIPTDNGVKISWTASDQIISADVELDSTSGSFIKGENVGGAGGSGTSGTINDFAVPTPGTMYLVKVKGGLQSGGTTGFSPPVQFTAATNFHSLRDFLKYSSVSGSSGMRRFFAADTEIKLRAVMGV